MDAVPEVRLIGEPCLRQVSVYVLDTNDPDFVRENKGLQEVLAKFRASHGFGRAISAPQVGVNKRFIALNLGDGPFTVVNPTITSKSEERFTMWDDCMSFPWLMVKVQRHKHITIRYTNEQGDVKEWADISQATSELLQHEIDHLDGVLAVDLAIDKDSIISRKVYEERLDYFNSQVDYAIQPTI